MGGFFAEFERAGLAERTIVIVTSDHGQGFGAHGSPGHGHRVYDDTLHVTMLWYTPGLIRPARHGGGVVSLADVVPTLYELLGLPAPHELQGLSLASTLTAGAPLDPRRKVFGKGLGPRHRPPRTPTGGR
jgi:arylsulfatase A-like enzyme